MIKCPLCGDRTTSQASFGGYYCWNYKCKHSKELIKEQTHYPAHKDISQRKKEG